MEPCLSTPWIEGVAFLCRKDLNAFSCSSVSRVSNKALAFFTARPETGGEAPLEVLVPAFGGLSLAIGVGTVVYRRIGLVGPIQSGSLDPSTPEGLQAGFQVLIILWVLSESVGIYGLVLSFLSGNPLFSVLFSAAALALLFVHRPTAADLQPPTSPTDRATDARPIA